MAVLGGDGDFKPGSEPDGFRGIKWGTDISTLKDMDFKTKKGLITIYTRKGDVLQVGTAQLKYINYIFWDGKLSSIMLETQGEDNYNRLKESTFEKFGKGRYYKSDDYPDDIDFMWNGKLTRMGLTYTQKSKEGDLGISSEEQFQKIKLYKQQKARENAN
jgi:hypothetical protein